MPVALVLARTDHRADGIDLEVQRPDPVRDDVVLTIVRLEQDRLGPAREQVQGRRGEQGELPRRHRPVQDLVALGQGTISSTEVPDARRSAGLSPESSTNRKRSGSVKYSRRSRYPEKPSGAWG